MVLIIILAAFLSLAVTFISIVFIPCAQNRSRISSDFAFSGLLFGMKCVCGGGCGEKGINPSNDTHKFLIEFS